MDLESGNLIGFFDSEEEVFKLISFYIEIYGELYGLAEVQHLGLLKITGEKQELVAMDEELVQRARNYGR